MINRYSSRRSELKNSFLLKRLEGARAYDRIAGYFSSSIIEIAGEALEAIDGPIRMVCNSDLQPEDVESIKVAHQAMQEEWCSIKPEEIYSGIPDRLIKLYGWLKSSKLQVKVLPNESFGLIHGKAGVITLADGSKTSFLGSMNESSSGWSRNYELAWEDNSEDAINWVEEEFNFLWDHYTAKPLADFIIEDIQRISKRQVIYEIKDWRKTEKPESSIIESPVYRKGFGLWEHQKYFIDKAFKAHKEQGGARLILADMVGLGKTVQLALAAQLMALHGDKPILVIAPKTLIKQWQEELDSLLDMPSAIWTGKEWIDEAGIVHPVKDERYITECPRRIGLVSQGLITAGSKSIDHLFEREYECIIVDESHRARRRNIKPGCETEPPDDNKLMYFLKRISHKTKSMLLATATPVQLHPIEAWDLLEILSKGSIKPMGDELSKWRLYPSQALELVTGKQKIDDEDTYWDWIRNPFPEADLSEKTFEIIRRSLDMNPSEYIINPNEFRNMRHSDKDKIRKLIEPGKSEFVMAHNPFIRCIVRRTRDHLENAINPKTGEPYLKKISIELLGEKPEESITLPPHLRDAYETAEKFVELLGKRVKEQPTGFLKTLLLRRLGSSIESGKITAQKILKNWDSSIIDEEDDDEDKPSNTTKVSTLRNLSEEEKICLQRFIKLLEEAKDRDPKYQRAKELLLNKKWLDLGCIIFSQYFDTINWLAKQMAQDLPQITIGLYAGGDKSGIYVKGIYYRKSKDDIKKMVKKGELKLLLGTDAASEGLNLQRLSTLINFDLPWNPTRLEQRKGRIQRIGQIRDQIKIYNMRYRDSIEDRVHSLLSQRLRDIADLFGQIPDALSDTWIEMAQKDEEEAKKIIANIPTKNPFKLKYEENVEAIDWESCSLVLDSVEKRKYLMKAW